MKKLLVALSISVVISANAFAEEKEVLMGTYVTLHAKKAIARILGSNTEINSSSSILNDIKDEKDLILVVDEKELKLKKKLNKRGE
jgi:hypothetical protein